MSKELTKEELDTIHQKLLALLVYFRDVCEKENIWYSLAFGTALGAVRENGFIEWDTDVDVYIKVTDKECVRKAFENSPLDGIYYKNHNNAERCLQSHDSLCYVEKQIINGIHLDIYPLVGAPDNEKEQRVYMKYLKYVDKIIRSKYSILSDCLPKNRIPVAIVKCIDYLIPDVILRKNIYKRETKYPYETAVNVTSLVNYGKIEECFPKQIFEKLTVINFSGEKFSIMKNWDEYLTRLYGSDYMIPKRY